MLLNSIKSQWIRLLKAALINFLYDNNRTINNVEYGRDSLKVRENLQLYRVFYCLSACFGLMSLILSAGVSTLWALFYTWGKAGVSKSTFAESVCLWEEAWKQLSITFKINVLYLTMSVRHNPLCYSKYYRQVCSHIVPLNCQQTSNVNHEISSSIYGIK